MSSIKKLVQDFKNKIRNNNFRVYDKRLERWTKVLPGDFLVITKEMMRELNLCHLKKKYKADLKRLWRGFKRSVELAKEDKFSRRLLFLNGEYENAYEEIYPCFVLFHFVYTKRNEFDMYVYQRSSDISKLKADLVLFSRIAQLFGRDTQMPVTKIVVVIGHAHF